MGGVGFWGRGWVVFGDEFRFRFKFYERWCLRLFFCLLSREGV